MTRPVEFEIADGISLDFDMIRITYKLYTIKVWDFLDDSSVYVRFPLLH